MASVWLSSTAIPSGVDTRGRQARSPIRAATRGSGSGHWYWGFTAHQDAGTAGTAKPWHETVCRPRGRFEKFRIPDVVAEPIGPVPENTVEWTCIAEVVEEEVRIEIGRVAEAERAAQAERETGLLGGRMGVEGGAATDCGGKPGVGPLLTSDSPFGKCSRRRVRPSFGSRGSPPSCRERRNSLHCRREAAYPSG